MGCASFGWRSTTIAVDYWNYASDNIAAATHASQAEISNAADRA
jgi:hypothetical protein